MQNDIESRIRLVSDNDIYQEALAFAAEVVRFAPEDRDLRSAQLNGLLVYARGEFRELERYVSHQAARRWETRDPEGHPTKRFYDALKKRLNQLRQRSRLEGWNLLPAGLSDNQARTEAQPLAEQLARDFVQHLVAEIFYRRSASGGSHGESDGPNEV